MPNPSADAADAIAAALARLRGRRMPRPPWEGGTPPHRPGHSAHHDPDGHGHHGPSWGAGGPHGRGHGGGPRFAGGRMAGPARLRLLEALVAASHPLSVSEIAEAIGVDQPRASRLVQQCVESGYVRREADPEDARRTRVALTDAGTEIVRGFRDERREAVGAALADFTDQERDELARLLTKLADAWPR